MKTVIIDLDFSDDSDVVATARGFGGTVVYYDRNGPGGGNPNYRIAFSDRAAAESYLRSIDYLDADDTVDTYIDA